MKKIGKLISVFIMLFSLSSVNYAKEIKVGLLLSMGGLGDKSFNDSAYAGLLRAEKDFKIKTKYIEPSSWSEDAMFLNEFVENDFDLIIATSYTTQDALEEIAIKYPKIKFAIIDTEAKGDNIASLMFKEEEGSFLVGALAGMMSKSKKIGFIGAADIPLINNFKKGYEQGALYIDPSIKILTPYIGGDSPYSDPIKGKEHSISMIKQNVDIIYHATGNTGNGIMEAIKEYNIYAIGVDSNQDEIVPGKVLTSMLKNIDNVIYDLISDTVNNKFVGGVHYFGIKENGVGTTDFKYTSEIIGKENLNKLERIKDDISNNKIKVKK
ncbi:MAG: BMP family lipoprotein [Fusobacteriaceae bacterium]